MSRLTASADIRVFPVAPRNSLLRITELALASISMKWLLFMLVKRMPSMRTFWLCPAMIPRELRMPARSITDWPPPAPRIAMLAAPPYPPTAPRRLPRDGGTSMNIEDAALNFFVQVRLVLTRVVPADSWIVVFEGT